MGHAKPMQRLVTLAGDIFSSTPIIQPAEGWFDGLNGKDLAVDVLILRNKDASGTGQQVLELETAVAPEGPWTVIATYNTAVYQHHQEYFTTTDGATNQFQRFVRWRLDISDSNLTGWETCFRICAVLK